MTIYQTLDVVPASWRCLPLTFDGDSDEGVNVVVRILQSNLVYGDGHVGTARLHGTAMH